MKILIIGGTGTISTAVVDEAKRQGHELTLINRGRSKQAIPEGTHLLEGDINDVRQMKNLLNEHQFDVAAQFIAFTPDQVERDLKLLAGKVKQYIFISSASAYRKPLRYYRIDESTPLGNVYWDYSQNKQHAEELLQKEAAKYGIHFTIVRPSHTYGLRGIPVGIHGNKGSYSVVKRIKEGKPIIVHGDGESLWTFTYNEDFARGFVGLFGHPQAIGEAVHITSDESLTWNRAYEIIAEVVGREPKLVHIASDRLIDMRPDLRGPLLGDKAVSVVFDNSKIKRLVPGFVCTTRYDQGVRKAYAHIQANPDLQTADPDFDEWSDQLVKLQRDFTEKNGITG